MGGCVEDAVAESTQVTGTYGKGAMDRLCSKSNVFHRIP